ncbi:phosphate uptake regulator PhoU [Candidatus Woesearchaeota archaeon]|nr:phosphate uptake regulator PhoU [Candidatus Woesearchaeota archaeon]
MRRKVSKVGPATLVVSLPSKFVKKYNIKKGDEVDIEEHEKKLVIYTEKDFKTKKIEIDVSGLDRSSLVYSIRIAYKTGFDEIHVKFKNTSAKHLRLNKEKSVLSIIHSETALLLGMEIIDEKDNNCILKDLSGGSIKAFEDIVKKIFNLLISSNKELIEAINKNNLSQVKTIEEKHNTITKFISYCLRIINKKGTKNNQTDVMWYHLITNLDEIIDTIKYCGRDFLLNPFTFSNEPVQTLWKIHKALTDFQIFFYTPKNENQTALYKTRKNILDTITKSNYKINELSLIIKWSRILEIIVDSIETRRGILLSEKISPE